MRYSEQGVKRWPLAVEVSQREASMGPSSDRISQLTKKFIQDPSQKERLDAEGVGAGAGAGASADADAGCEKNDGRPLAITSDWNQAR